MTKYNLRFWKTFYKIRYYSSITEQQTASEIKFLKEFLPRDRYKNILDFICGFGRHSVELAKNGYKVEGFDIDKDSIQQAKKLIKKLKLKNIRLYSRDALKFKKQNFFDAAICLYSSIGFLDEKSNEKIFKNLFQSVKIGGRIILDVMNSDWAIEHLKSFSEKEITYKGKKYFIRHKRKIFFNPIREKNIIEFLDKKNFSKYTTHYILRLYSFKELKEKIQKNNFRIYRNFGSFYKEKISKYHQRIIIIADKLKS